MPCRSNLYDVGKLAAKMDKTSGGTSGKHVTQYSYVRNSHWWQHRMTDWLIDSVWYSEQSVDLTAIDDRKTNKQRKTGIYHKPFLVHDTNKINEECNEHRSKTVKEALSWAAIEFSKSRPLHEPYVTHSPSASINFNKKLKFVLVFLKSNSVLLSQWIISSFALLLV